VDGAAAILGNVGASGGEFRRLNVRAVHLFQPAARPGILTVVRAESRIQTLSGESVTITGLRSVPKYQCYQTAGLRGIMLRATSLESQDESDSLKVRVLSSARNEADRPLALTHNTFACSASPSSSSS
jgi:hypothetical protein